MCANSEGSDKTAWMRKLAWALAGHLCDKYQNLKSWLNCTGPIVLLTGFHFNNAHLQKK